MKHKHILSLIIPAHNEANRIVRTLKAYHSFFENIEIVSDGAFDFELVVALNGCTDNTADVVQNVAHECKKIVLLKNWIASYNKKNQTTTGSSLFSIILKS